MTIMAGATIATSLPQMENVFSANENADLLSRLILTMPAIFIAFLAPVAGYIIDATGRRKLLIISLFLYALGGTSGLYFSNIYLILAGRALLGVAVAGTMTTTITLIADYFEGKERRDFMGYQAAFMSLGGVIFISLGGVLADVHWRWPFALYLFSLLVMVLAIKFIEEPQIKSSPRRAGFVKLSVAPSYVFLIYLMAFLGFVFFYIVPVEMPFLLRQTTEISNTIVGISLGVSILMGAVVSFNYSKFKERMSFPLIYAFTFLFMGAGYIVFWFAGNYVFFLIGLILQGMGTGLLMPNSNLWLVSIAPDHLRGRLIGNLSFAVYIGQFLSPLIFSPFAKLRGIQPAFGIFGIMMLFISLAFILFHYKKYKNQE